MNTELLPISVPTAQPVARGPVRPAYAVVGLLALGGATWGAVATGASGWWVVLFAVLPDLALLAGVGGGHRPGQLPRRAVPAYNLLHHPAGPAVLAVAAGALGSASGAVAAASWAAHIALDRSLGYGLRDADGWQRG